MKYLKTNEALFTGKSEKIFEKLIQNFENKLREEGLEFEKKKNDLWLGRTPKSVLKRVDYLITEKNAVKGVDSHFEYKYAIALIKESTFDTPFIHVKCDCSLSLGDLISAEHRGLMEMTQAQLSENPISIFGLMDPCKRQALSRYNRGTKSRDFYQTFPIDDIRDRLYDLSDELGVEFEVEPIKTGIDGYDVEFDLSIKFEKREYQGFHYVKADMDLYSKLITELNNLYKVFDSMGLSLYFDPFSIIHTGSVYIEILEKKEKPDGE
jgi:hypothetical protein